MFFLIFDWKGHNLEALQMYAWVSMSKLLINLKLFMCTIKLVVGFVLIFMQTFIP